DADDTTAQVDVLDAKSLQLAAAEPGVHRRGPERAILLEGGDKRGSVRRGADPIASAAHRGQLQPARGLYRDLSADDRAADHRAQRHQRIADRRRAEAVADHVLDEVLEIHAREA